MLSPGHLSSSSASLVPLPPPLSPCSVKSWRSQFQQRASVSLVLCPQPPYSCSVTVLDTSLPSVSQCIACPTLPDHPPRVVSHSVSFVPHPPPPSPCSVTQCVICPTSPSTIPVQCHTVCHLSHVPLHHPRAVSHSVSFVPRPPSPSLCSVTQCVTCPTSPSTIPVQCRTVCHLSHVPLHHPRAVSHSVSLVPRPTPPSSCSVAQCLTCPTSPSTIPVQCHTVCHLSQVPLHHPRAVSHSVSFVSRTPPPSPCSVTQCVTCLTSPSTIPVQCHTVCHLSHVPLHHPRAVSHSVSFVPGPTPPSPCSVAQCVTCPTSSATIPVQCHRVCHLSHAPLHHPRAVSHSEHLASHQRVGGPLVVPESSSHRLLRALRRLRPDEGSDIFSANGLSLTRAQKGVLIRSLRWFDVRPITSNCLFHKMFPIDLFHILFFFFKAARARVCVCVCVCVRARARERVRGCACVSVPNCFCYHKILNVHTRVAYPVYSQDLALSPPPENMGRERERPVGCTAIFLACLGSWCD